MSAADAAGPPDDTGVPVASATPDAAKRREGGTTRPRIAIVTMFVVLALAATHMFLTATVNMPYSHVKYEVLPGQLADAYARPYLVQNYRIFAPNPASEDRELWVRAWIEDDDGIRTETAWINATAVELADTSRKVLRKQLTIVGAEAYMAAYRGLTAPQREVVTGGNFHRDGDRVILQSALAERGSAGAYMRASDYVTAYATQVAHALYGDDHEILAVQSRIVYEPVVRWRDRDDPDAAPPARTETRAGWREPLEYPTQDREEFARSFLSWLDRAGSEAYPR